MVHCLLQRWFIQRYFFLHWLMKRVNFLSANLYSHVKMILNCIKLYIDIFFSLFSSSIYSRLSMQSVVSYKNFTILRISIWLLFPRFCNLFRISNRNLFYPHVFNFTWVYRFFMFPLPNYLLLLFTKILIRINNHHPKEQNHFHKLCGKFFTLKQRKCYW